MILTSIYVNAWQEPVGELRVIQEEADGREIEVTVFGTDGQPIDFSGKTVSVYLEKPDGTMVYNTCAVSGSTVTITLTLQMMAVAGRSKLFELQIIDSDSHTLKVTLPPLHIVPSNYDGAIESTDEFTALTQALAQIDQATEDANTATGAANAAASAATTAAGSANTAAQTANTAAGNADDAADAANTAASAANTAKDSANNAASAANTAAGLANTAAGAANTAAGAANSAAQAANEAAEEASTTAATTATNVINQQKGVANGLATLDSSGKLSQMPTAADVGAIPTSEKAAAGGVATLDANSKVVQSPASAGQANGLATLNASGKVSQPLASAENLTSQVTIASNVNFSKPVIYRIGNCVFIYYYFSWTGATVGQYNNALSGLPAPSPSTNYYFVDYKDTTVDIQIASNGTMNFNPRAASGANCYGMLFYPC